MAYNNFTLKEVLKQFKLALHEEAGLFDAVPGIKPSNFLQDVLSEHEALAVAINTEKGRSELLIMPVLVEVRRQLHNHISLFSGIKLDVAPEEGLTGFCDYLIAQSPIQQFLTTPIIAIAEAKNDNPQNGLGQCIAEMIAARRFNEREGNTVPVIYGVSTTGTAWRFLKLEGVKVVLDQSDYYITEVDKILGILVHICQHQITA